MWVWSVLLHSFYTQAQYFILKKMGDYLQPHLINYTVLGLFVSELHLQDCILLLQGIQDCGMGLFM